MAELLCLSWVTIICRCLSEALRLADDEEKNFNHRTTKCFYIRNLHVEKGDYLVHFALNRRRKNEICTLFVSSADE